MTADLVTARLALRLMGPDVVAAALTGDLARAGRLLGAAIPADLLAAPSALQHARARLEEDPLYAPWSARALILPDGAMAGLVRFHSRPGPADLGAWGPDAVELGYRVFAAHRRRGYASEAVAAAMAWAEAQGVGCFVASVAPDNQPSLRVVERLGFAKVGEQLDPVDGIEHVFLRRAAAYGSATLTPTLQCGRGRDPR